MSESKLKTARIVSVVAATVISLSCGTNYAYSAWAPQFATKMKLSKTESNLIGTFGNLGMYAAGIPVGLFVDSKGPRPGVMMGAFLLGIGYYVMHKAYNDGPGSISLPWLCFFQCLTGIGGAAAFSGSIKTSALNWPNHRGTATGFPLSAFGLSAFFFVIMSSFAFPNNTSDFLLMLAIGTFAMCFASFFFLRVIPHPPVYSAIPTNDHERNSSPLKRTKSEDRKYSAGRIPQEPGTQEPVIHPESIPLHDDATKDSVLFNQEALASNRDTDETSSLISKSSSSSPGDIPFGDDDAKPASGHTNQTQNRVDIRGIALLSKVEFWQLFLLLGLLTGIGLMTINNIGNDAIALWGHYDDSASPKFVQERQLMHVSILSVLSFVGRLCSGAGSDLIVKKLNMSRFWCLFTSSVIFTVAQLCGARIQNPHLLSLLSGLTGLAYGFLFGVYPSLVAETFGVAGLSQNWGCMTLAPVISGNIFNLIYGRIYDGHSSVGRGGVRACTEGRGCYEGAYWVTFGASVVGVMVSLWSIRWDHVMKAKRRKGEMEAAREA